MFVATQAATADGSGKMFGFDKWQRGADPSNGSGFLNTSYNFSSVQEFHYSLVSSVL